MQGSYVRALLEDERGRLWIAVRFGVLRYDGVTCRQVPLSPEWVDASGARALHETDDGGVWLGLFRGGAVRLDAKTRPPTIGRLQLSVDGRRERSSEFVAFTTSSLAFDFHGVTFAFPPAELEYRYRLEGHDADWRYTRERSTTYQDLAPGEYAFEVQAIDSELAYSGPARISFRVRRQYFTVVLGSALALAFIAWQAVRLVSRNRALKRLGDELESRVRERTARLEETTATLRAAESTLRRLAARLITVQEEERRHLARELHDDLTQQLASLGMEAEIVRSQIRPAATAVDEALRGLGSRARSLAKQVGELSRHLHPKILTDLGLVMAVESECDGFAKRTGIALTCDANVGEGILSADAALTVFRILQESLHNIERHAETERADVALFESNGGVTLAIRDFGRGFGLDGGNPQGLGLVSMEERAVLVGGSVVVQSTPGDGTLVELTVPVSIDSPDDTNADTEIDGD